MPGDTLLAVSLTRSDPPLADQVAAAVRAGADLIELRVDHIHDDGGVERLLRQPHAVPFIVTVRRADEGGAWDRDEASRIALLERLGRLRPGFIDVEHASWLRSPHLRRTIASFCTLEVNSYGGTGRSPSDRARGRNELILSHHDLRGTPDNLDEVFEALEASPASVVKAVFAAHDALDAFRVLAQLDRRGGRRRVIALATGEAGFLTRVLARKLGAFLTFAALERGAEAAPEQPTLADLRETYRWDEINPRTRVFGVIGWPVTHSLSPRLHNAAMTAEGINGVYLPLPVGPAYEGLARFLDYATDNDWLDFAGASVTIPHKEHVARWLTEQGYPTGNAAARCRAVNTLVRTAGGGWRGENTDTAGVLEALESMPELARDGLKGRTVDVLGAGGVARAVLAALGQRGARITIYNRSNERARALAEQFSCDWRAWDERSTGTGDILVNCTSVGTAPDAHSSPVAPARLRPGTVVFDTVYNPQETRLLCEARARGCRVISGIEMFVAQAGQQFTHWHARPAPLAKVREASFDRRLETDD